MRLLNSYGRHGLYRACQTVVGAERLHRTCYQDRSSGGGEIPERYAIPRRPGLLEHGGLPGDRPSGRMVLTDNFADEKGNIVPASHYGMTGEWPKELLVTLTFEEQKGKTKFTLLHEGMPPGEMTEQAKAGWNESFDKLEKVIEEEKSRWGKNIIFTGPGKQEASIIRIFNAPPERVFKAYTDPELMPLVGAQEV